ncbi:Animal haem peroxidase [Parafrankia sp. EAN1pec]|uniref:peroxidase family protein n=1 Tax=Parafrankia sp. (strain EAN1pec) TaxID=298653 RepID=UPI000054259D|nr:Animal haem peroxidase [Frankia sp. EAN1pec]
MVGIRLEKGSQGRSSLSRIYDAAAVRIDRRIGWSRFPPPLGLALLFGLRNVLRRENLFDTDALPSSGGPVAAPYDDRYLVQRTADGSWNDLDEPTMGMAGTRFGRNVPLANAYREPEPQLLSPNPRDLSRALLTRTTFQPAETVNSLVAAWIQFMVRDWFSHGAHPTDNPWVLPVRGDDDWPDRPMEIPRTTPDPTRPPRSDDSPWTSINVVSHWWDGSQIYGTTRAEQQRRRSKVDGKLRVGPGGLPGYFDEPGKDPAREPGFWLGLALFHTVFTREHNAICDRLHAAYPDWSDDDLFERARLINAALMAKIHTVEWTPAVISHPTTVAALRTNWWGLAGERIHNLVGRISSSEVISGIPGSETDHFDVPYSLTEEFVAVYRMHPLVRDEWSLRSAADNTVLRESTLRDLTGAGALDALAKISTADLLYSFGTLHPGLVTLHNFPHHLQNFIRPDGKLQDLAATDILRTRELGVPRYNEFRRLLHLEPAKDFADITGRSDWAAELDRAYDGDVERLDLVVGLLAERLPRGFAFSDTAFRIFILMASRRLNSDRFLSRDFRPEIYTQEGIDWIGRNSLSTVLLRHFPELRPALRSVENAFAPWTAADDHR